MVQAQVRTQRMGELAASLMDFLPNLLAALALALAGFLVARLLRAVTIRVVRAWSARLAGTVGRLVRSREAETRVRQAGSDARVGATIGGVVFWLVFLFFLAGATETLGLPVVSTWLSGVAGYLPRVVAAILIGLLGALVGSVGRSAVAGAASSAGFAQAGVLGRMAQAVVLMVTAVVAFDQLGIEITFLIVVAAIATAAMLGSGALAFGLGARTAVSNIIASHYLHQIYQVGHSVRIGGLEGRILEITPTSVVVGTGEGRAVVPAKQFSEQISTLLAE